MTADHPNAEFTDVDRAADPQAYVTMLDRQHARASTQAYKRRALALLDPQPGQRILDVGCGVGVDTLALARLVAPAGQVVGLDYSQTMVDEARRRSQGTPLPVNFEQGDVQRLAYPDATFDRCYADRAFQHLPDPLLALTELRRVLKPGSALVIVDPDHEMRVIDTPYPAVTCRFLNFRSDTFQQGGIAHRLYALFHQNGAGCPRLSSGGGMRRRPQTEVPSH